MASVVFTVNGQALPAVTGPSFSRIFNVGPASTTPTLTIAASARDSNNVEVAHDQRTVNVVVGLSVTPTLSGVPLGGTRTLTLLHLESDLERSPDRAQRRRLDDRQRSPRIQ